MTLQLRASSGFLYINPEDVVAIVVIDDLDACDVYAGGAPLRTHGNNENVPKLMQALHERHARFFTEQRRMCLFEDQALSLVRCAMTSCLALPFRS